MCLSSPHPKRNQWTILKTLPNHTHPLFSTTIIERKKKRSFLRSLSRLIIPHARWQLNSTTKTRHHRGGGGVAMTGGNRRLAVGAVGNGRSPAVVLVVAAALFLCVVVSTGLRVHAVHWGSVARGSRVRGIRWTREGVLNVESIVLLVRCHTYVHRYIDQQ